jgi:hypothetical protein
MQRPQSGKPNTKRLIEAKMAAKDDKADFFSSIFETVTNNMIV